MNDPHVICIACGADRSCYNGANPARPPSIRREMRAGCLRIDEHQDKPCSFLTLGASEAHEFLRLRALREEKIKEDAQ